MAQTKKTAGINSKLAGFILLTVLISLGAFVWDWHFSGDQPAIIMQKAMAETIEANTTQPDCQLTTVETIETIPIYLVGAVFHPGIYQVEKGSYLYQLVEKAGGLTEDAASDSINLALRLESNQMIHLPTKSEIIENPAAFNLESAQENSNAILDLNRADLDQLDNLPGIGPSTAQAILEYRNKNGPFRKIEDLMKISGIKESRFNALKDLVYVKGCS